jgi:hypothetical protein|tara:strand:- start:3746 stop:5203 length:1458 start_codon:yes stop_codon:yes gene_type:complete
MHLQSDSPFEANLLVQTLTLYYYYLDSVKSEQDGVGYIIGRIGQYYKAYPEAEGKHFYIKLDTVEVHHLLASFKYYRSINEGQKTETEEKSFARLEAIAEEYLELFGDFKITEELTLNLFDQYKKELAVYCQNLIDGHVKGGNQEIYVFSIQTFPGHHYQLPKMNSVKSLHEMSDGDGFIEAAEKGYASELYNPACFDIEGESHDEYQKIESEIEELFNQFYELTDEYSINNYKDGSTEYAELKRLEDLANYLFLSNSVDVINSLNFEELNKSNIFCALVSSYEFSEEEFYTQAKKTIPEEKFSKIFPNAFRVVEDYINFDKTTPAETATYLISYIKDFHMNTVPKGRFYTYEKVYEYQDKLKNYEVIVDNEILNIVEDIVRAAQPNPHNPEEIHFINLFSKEGHLCSDLLSVLHEVENYECTTQKRLVEIFKKVIIGMKPSLQHLSFLHRDLAMAIHNTDKLKYSKLVYDLETSYLKNTQDYVM